MDNVAVQGLITDQIVSFGVAALAILSAILLQIIAFLVFRWGARKIAQSAGEPNYMRSYDGINLDAVSDATRNAIRRSYPKNTEGI